MSDYDLYILYGTAYHVACGMAGFYFSEWIAVPKEAP